MKFEYCPKCGEFLSQKEIGDEGLVPYCNNCQRPFFDIPSPCIIVAAINEYNEVTLIKQSRGKDRFVCIAGFIKIGEGAEECAIREVKEEIGIKVDSIEFVRSYPMEKQELLMLGFMARIKKSDFVLSKELKEAKWFSADDAMEVLKGADIAYRLTKESFERILN